MVSHPSTTPIRITLERLKELCAYLSFGPKDEHNLERIRQLIVEHLDGIIERFYTHIIGFENLRPFLDDRATRRRIKKTLREYILTLGKHARTLEYAQQRLRMGMAHERIGLNLNWFLGVYPVLFESITSVVASSPDVDRELPRLLASLQKAITLDSVLAAEAYHHASTRRLEEIVADQRVSQERLHRESTLDGLTQILNKRAVMMALEAEFLQCRRQQLPFSAMILDVDRFKQINDHHGHPFGDYVLRHVVDIVRNAMRPGDIVGRFGGDEIIVGLGGCSMGDAAKIAERIRLKVAQTPFQHRRQTARITLSLGVACSCLSPPRARTLDSVIDRADQALYGAKQEGRNRTCLSEPGPAATGMPAPTH